MKQKLNKILNVAKMYYRTFGSNCFYMREKLLYQDEMIKQKLIEVRYLPGSIYVIKITGAGKLLTSGPD